MRISYRKAVDAVAASFAYASGYPEDARREAERILDPLLTPAGRKALR